MIILVIALIVTVVWIVSLYHQLEQAKSHLRKLPEAAKEIDDNINTLEVEVLVLRRALLDAVRSMNKIVNEVTDAKNNKKLDLFKKPHNKSSIAAQTVSIYLANLDNTWHADELNKRIYREHGLPEQFRSPYAATLEQDTLENWDKESWDANYEKYESMLKRKLTTDFENMQDEMDSESKYEEELNKKYSQHI